MSRIKNIGHAIKEAGSGFIEHQGLKLSASLCFYSIFSIGPMMIVIIFISNIFFGRQAIDGTIYKQISSITGNAAAMQIQDLIKNAAISSNTFMALVGFVALIFTATTVFTEMQESINIIWNLQVKKGRGLLQSLKNRLLSFLIIMCLGILLLIFLIANGVLEGFMGKIQNVFPQVAIPLVYAVNLTLTLIVVAILFVFIFKVLPDAHIRWKDVVVGSLFAAVLFMIGKFGLTLYIDKSNMNSSYSPAGAWIILLLWTYYSAAVLYFGAEFTKSYALRNGASIRPKDYAVTVKIVIVENNESVQANEELGSRHFY